MDSTTGTELATEIAKNPPVPAAVLVTSPIAADTIRLNSRLSMLRLIWVIGAMLVLYSIYRQVSMGFYGR